MKRIFSIFIMLSLILSMCACSKSGSKSKPIDFNSVGTSSSITDTETENDMESSDKANASDTDSLETVSVLGMEITSNEFIEAVTQPVKKTFNEKSFALKVSAAVNNMISSDTKNYDIYALVEYDIESKYLKLSADVNEEKHAVYINGDFILNAKYDGDESKWDISTSENSTDFDSVFNAIDKFESFSKDGSMIDASSLVKKLLEVVGMDADIDESKLQEVAQSIINKFTSKENLKLYLGYTKADNTDGTTYSFSPDISLCFSELPALMQPLFKDEESSQVFMTMMSMYEITLMGASLSAGIKVDKNDYLNEIKLDFLMPENMQAELNAQFTEIGAVEVEFDSEIEKAIKGH